MSTFKKVWLIPLLLGAITLFGLLAALLGTGYWYYLAWGALSLPLLIMCFKIFLKRA